MTIDRQWVAEVLGEDNPRAKGEALALYAAAFCTYWESETNIRANGLICAHPRTGAPLENPYLRVREQAMKALASMGKARLQTDRLWREAGERVGQGLRDPGQSDSGQSDSRHPVRTSD